MLRALAILAAALPAADRASEGGWELVAEARDVEVFERPRAGSSSREVQAVGEADAPPQRLFRVPLGRTRRPPPDLRRTTPRGPRALAPPGLLAGVGRGRCSAPSALPRHERLLVAESLPDRANARCARRLR